MKGKDVTESAKTEAKSKEFDPHSQEVNTFKYFPFSWL